MVGAAGPALAASVAEVQEAAEMGIPNSEAGRQGYSIVAVGIPEVVALHLRSRTAVGLGDHTVAQTVPLTSLA